MKAAILGSKGFLGSLILNEMTNCYLMGVHRNLCDLTDFNQLQSLLKKEKFDIIINCATQGGKENISDFNYNQFVNNLKIFENLISLRDTYGLLLNIGSGAEFDTQYGVFETQEKDLGASQPKDSYSLSKFIISRECRKFDNMITLRLFGCFHPTEPNFRLLRNYCNTVRRGQTFVITKNRKFSWLSGFDFIAILEQIVDYYEHNEIQKLPKDINCAYNEQLFLHEIITKWCLLHNTEISYKIDSISKQEYTCDNSIMNKYFKVKYGLEESLRIYV